MSNPRAQSNTSVLGDGSKSADHAHVKQITPIELKKREFNETKQFRTDLNAGFDTKRQTATRKARQQGKVRPV